MRVWVDKLHSGMLKINSFSSSNFFQRFQKTSWKILWWVHQTFILCVSPQKISCITHVYHLKNICVKSISILCITFVSPQNEFCALPVHQKRGGNAKSFLCVFSSANLVFFLFFFAFLFYPHHYIYSVGKFEDDRNPLHFLYFETQFFPETNNFVDICHFILFFWPTNRLQAKVESSVEAPGNQALWKPPDPQF